MTFYLICAVTGAALLGWRLLLVVFRFGGQPTLVQGHALHSIADLLAQITAQSFALACFGVAGFGVASWEWPEPVPLLSGLFFGTLVLFLVRTLEHPGAAKKLPTYRTVGKKGTVSRIVPPQKSGRGRVKIEVQDQIVELRAVTMNGKLAVGTRVVVRAVAGPETVEVAADVDYHKEWQRALGRS